MYNITDFDLLYRIATVLNLSRLGDIFYYNGPSSISSFYGGHYEWKTERSIQNYTINAAVSYNVDLNLKTLFF